MKRWAIAIRGTESGSVHELTFLRFWTWQGANRWLSEHRNNVDLTEWIIVRHDHRHRSDIVY